VLAAEESKPGASQPPLPKNAGKETLERMDKLRNAAGPLSTAQIRGKMQKAMQEDAAVFRTQVPSLTLTHASPPLIPTLTGTCELLSPAFPNCTALRVGSGIV